MGFQKLIVVVVVGLFLMGPNIENAFAADYQCVVCGMKVPVDAKGGFEATRNEKTVHFCSFFCAKRFHSHKKYQKTPLFTKDYLTGEKIDALSAHYLTKSKKLSKEVTFGMAPIVAAFKSEAPAKKVQSEYKEGVVVKGFAALEKLYN